MRHFNETIEVGDGVDEAPSHGAMSPDVTILLLTWVTFFTLLGILYKFAWKPILAGLDQREDSIRRSLEEAEKIHQEYERIDADITAKLKEAQENAKEIIIQSRKAAIQAAKVIEKKAKEESQIILENTQREIKAEIGKAKESLKRDSAEIATQLAIRILEKNLDDQQNRKLVETFLQKI